MLAFSCAPSSSSPRHPSSHSRHVFDPEPLPDSHPYWQHPRVLATSHGASFGDGMAARGDQLFLDNLARLLAGEPLHKEVPPVA